MLKGFLQIFSNIDNKLIRETNQMETIPIVLGNFLPGKEEESSRVLAFSLCAVT